VGLPPTPEELGLADEAYDVYIDSLPPWERNKVLKEDRPVTEWDRKQKLLWWAGFLASLAWASVMLPVVILSFIIPPIGFIMWIVGFAPLGASISCRLQYYYLTRYNEVT